MQGTQRKFTKTALGPYNQSYIHPTNRQKHSAKKMPFTDAKKSKIVKKSPPKISQNAGAKKKHMLTL